jgi:hypothetical protein
VKNPFSHSLAARSAAELVIIVAGVLIALAANDWWADRQDRAEELDILLAISADISITHDLVLDHIDTQKAILDNLRTLSGGSSGTSKELDDGELARVLFNGLWEIDPMTVQMSAYEEAQSSGRIRLIDDQRLRRLLADYDRSLLAVRARIDDAYQHQQTKVDSFVMEHFQMAQFAEPALTPLDGILPLEQVLEMKDHRGLLDDEFFQNVVASKFFILGNGLRYAGELLVTLDELSSATEDRINELPR